MLTEVAGDPIDLAVADRDDAARRAVALAVLDAYAAVHERGVLHGDVHAGNVLLRPDGTVTLIDFGLAQVSGATRPRRAPLRGRAEARDSTPPAPERCCSGGLPLSTWRPSSTRSRRSSTAC